MDRKSGTNYPSCIAIGCEAAATVAARQRERDEAIAAQDADMAQSPAGGLNRTVSIKKDKPLLAALDESKTNNKSLCGHVIYVQCEAALAMDEARRRRDAARAMHEAEQSGSAEAIDDAEQYDASVATDSTGQRKSELVNDAEQCDASVAADGAGQRKSGVISDAGQYGAGVDNDAGTVQGPENELNRTVSIEKDEFLPVKLDKVKTKNKSLKERIRGLSLVRKIVGFFKTEPVNDAEQCDASVAADSTGQRKSGVISDAGQYGAGVDNDAGTVQGPENELNRTVSIEKDEFLPVKLDKVKTKNKSLKERIRGLSLVRKIVGFFKRIFRSGKVIDSDSKKGGETIVSTPAAGSGKLPVSEEWCIQEANSLFNDVNELGKAMAVEDPPFNDWQNARTSIEDMDRRISRLIDSLEEKGGPGDLDEKILQIQMGIDWIMFNIQNRKSKCDYISRNMRYYNAILTCYYESAKVALEDSDPELLRQLENFYLQSGSCIKNEVNNGNAFGAMHNLEIFDNNALQLIDSVDRRDVYEQEFMRRQPVEVPVGIKR